jgi:hypothetical protein
MEGQKSAVYAVAVASLMELRWFIFDRRLVRKVRIDGQASRRSIIRG